MPPRRIGARKLGRPAPLGRPQCQMAKRTFAETTPSVRREFLAPSSSHLPTRKRAPGVLDNAALERLTASFSFAIAPGRKYTNRTLRGDYGFTAEGVLISIPGLPAQAPFRSVGLAHFYGKGNLTWLEHTVVNGTLLEADWPAAPIASMQISPEAQW